MNEKKVPCPICGGSGTFVTQTHYQDEIVEQYCSCWRGWLLFQRKANEEMTVEKIPLSEAKPWGIQDNGDYLGRPDGAFFRVIAVRVKTNKREVEGGWTQVMLEEVGKGFVVLVKSVDKEGEPIFLLTSKPEPGNPADKNYVLCNANLAGVFFLPKIYFSDRIKIIKIRRTNMFDKLLFIMYTKSNDL